MSQRPCAICRRMLDVGARDDQVLPSATLRMWVCGECWHRRLKQRIADELRRAANRLEGSDEAENGLAIRRGELQKALEEEQGWEPRAGDIRRWMN